MDTFKYITDNKGNKTGLLIDLLTPQKEDFFKNLNQNQIEFLKLFRTDLPDETVEELKKLVAGYLAEKMLDNGDRIWNEKKYTKADFENFVEND